MGVGEMKVYWFYMCDFGHEWSFFRDEAITQTVEDALCPFGHEAVTIQKRPPVDEVILSVEPAGYLADAVRNQIAYENQYRLVITNLEGDLRLVSQQTYTWRNVIHLLERFHTTARSAQAAQNLWQSLNP
jgi:hypothetical protein